MPSRQNATPTAPRQLISLAEAAEMFGVNPKTIRRRVTDGTLTGHRLGPRLIRVDRDEVNALLHTIPSA